MRHMSTNIKQIFNKQNWFTYSIIRGFKNDRVTVLVLTFNLQADSIHPWIN